MEDRTTDERLWTRDEQGNVMADIAASNNPERLRKKYPHTQIKRIKAEEMLDQISPKYIWNLYREDGKPTTWESLQTDREDRLQQTYVINRTLLSCNIGRHRDWKQKNMALAAHIWQAAYTRGRGP